METMYMSPLSIPQHQVLPEFIIPTQILPKMRALNQSLRQAYRKDLNFSTLLLKL